MHWKNCFCFPASDVIVSWHIKEGSNSKNNRFSYFHFFILTFILPNFHLFIVGSDWKATYT